MQLKRCFYIISLFFGSLSSVSFATGAELGLVQDLNFNTMFNINMRFAQLSNPYQEGFMQMVEALKNEQIAENGNLLSYAYRFSYDQNVWATLLGGFGGKYDKGYNALGGISVGYDAIFDRTLWGGYIAYAYSNSVSKKSQDYLNDISTHHIELGSYLRTYIDAHEIDVVLSEIFAFGHFNSPIVAPANLRSFTTSLNVRYGYVFPVNPKKGFYIKPYGGIDLFYQYQIEHNRQVLSNSNHVGGMNLSAFVELRQYSSENIYYYFAPGIQQDIFNLAGTNFFLGNSFNHDLVTYNIGKEIRTYFVVIGGGEFKIRNNYFINIGVGGKFSWDRYFVNANIGFKYRFNSK